MRKYHTLLQRLGLRGRNLRERNQLSWPEIGEQEADAVLELLAKRELSIPSEEGVIERLSRAFRKAFGVRFALPQNSGTSTLHAAYFGLGVGPGDEVVVPSLTFHSSASMIAVLGAKPVFCEVDPQTLTLCPRDLLRRITPRTRAVCAVHLYGIPADMRSIRAVCSEHGVPIVEDCAQAHGAAADGRLVGAIGSAGCVSLQQMKGIAAGEGGVLLTDDPEVYDRALFLGHFGLAASKGVTGRYADMRVTGVGFKYRIHPLAAALALEQLKRFPEKLKRVRRYCARLAAALAGTDEIRVVSPPEGGERGVYQFGFVVSVPKLATAPGYRRKLFFYNLRRSGIAADKPAPLLHLDRRFRGRLDVWRPPPYPDRPEHRPGDLPATESIHRTLVVFEQYFEHIDEAVERTQASLRREIARL